MNIDNRSWCNSNTLPKDEVLFGSTYPVLSPGRWIEEFERLPIKPVPGEHNPFGSHWVCSELDQERLTLLHAIECQ